MSNAGAFGERSQIQSRGKGGGGGGHANGISSPPRRGGGGRGMAFRPLSMVDES